MATVIYARKSTESEDRQVQSLDDQVRALTELAKREGIQISDVIRESKSAKTPYSRPEFQKMIGRIESGEIDGVLTWAVNRLNRNLIDGGIIAHLLQTGKLSYIRTPERHYRPEDNVLILSIENGMATSFIQDLSRNVKRGMQGKADRGWMPGQAPVGYINNLRTGEIDPDPERFDLVRRGWKMLLSGGFTVAEVNNEFRRLGLTSPLSTKGSKPISRASVYSIFNNPFYYGKFRFREELYTGRHQPMISEADFITVQRMTKGAPVRRQHNHDHVFAGLLRCGVCGCQVVGETKIKSFKTSSRIASYTYYHCSGSKGCPKRSISEENLLNAFKAVYNQLKMPRAFTDWARNTIDRMAYSDHRLVSASLSQIEEDIQTKQKRLERLTEMRISGELSGSEYLDLKTQASRELTDLVQRKSELQTEADRIDQYIRQLFDLIDQIGEGGELSPAVQRTLVRSIGKNHLLTLGQPIINLNPVTTKIIAFEPRRIGSGSFENHDSEQHSLDWHGFLDDLRTAAIELFVKNDQLSHALSNIATLLGS